MQIENNATGPAPFSQPYIASAADPQHCLEREAIASLVCEPRLLAPSREFLEPGDFGDRHFRALYQALLESQDELGRWSLGGILEHLAPEAGDPIRVQALEFLRAARSEYHALALAPSVWREVRAQGALRRAGELGARLHHDAAGYVGTVEQVEETIAGAGAEILRAAEPVAELSAQSSSAATKSVLAAFEEAQRAGTYPGLRTGFTRLDEALSGLRGGKLYVLGARPAVGKSALALNVAQFAASAISEGRSKPARVLFVSVEMSESELISRAISSEAGVTTDDLRHGNVPEELIPHMLQVAARIAERTVYPVFKPGITIHAIEELARRRRDTDGLDLLIVDYLQRVKVPGMKDQNRYLAVAEVGASLKRIAGELDIPVLALAQLGRAAEHADRPSMAHLRESGDIEADADVIMLLHRVTTSTAPGDRERELEESEATLAVVKNRDGPTGLLSLEFQGRFVRFQNPGPVIEHIENPDHVRGAPLEPAAAPSPTQGDLGYQ